MHTPRFWSRSNLLLAMLLTLSLSACAWFAPPPPSPPKISRPIIFLHGVNQDASKMGVPLDKTSNNAFVPLIQNLEKVYDPRYIQIFKYLDDQAITPCPKDTYPPCRSQGSITANAKELAKQIQVLYVSANATPTTTEHHKITLIGY